MRGVAFDATLVDGGVLEGEGSLVFGMAGETQIVSVGRIQTVTRAAAMGIVAIDGSHLALANWMVIRQVRFGHLLLVAAQAFVIHLAAGLDGLPSTLGLALEFAFTLAVSVAMNGVAVAAPDALSLVRAQKPVAHVI